ncbi:MAG: hypothetical protein ABIH03_09675, partial [Pseudomonadota bacterium]
MRVMKFSSQTGASLAIGVGVLVLVAISLVEYSEHLDEFALWGEHVAILLLLIGAGATHFHLKQLRRDTTRLRDSENLLAQTHRIAQLGAFSWDFVSNEVTWSTTLYEIHGITPNTEINLER